MEGQDPKDLPFSVFVCAKAFLSAMQRVGDDHA
jgi:hypothetical protein